MKNTTNEKIRRRLLLKVKKDLFDFLKNTNLGEISSETLTGTIYILFEKKEAIEKEKKIHSFYLINY
jgi:hypothetical protein